MGGTNKTLQIKTVPDSTMLSNLLQFSNYLPSISMLS